MEKSNFGTKLIEVRKAKGLTQDEVAERCKITTRTIQRIESGQVKPRTFTIKLISETLEFDFFMNSENSDHTTTENQDSKLKNHTILWCLKDLFNLKTNTMKKISILSASFLVMTFTLLFILDTKAQKKTNPNQKNLIVQLNEDKSLKRIEVAFTNNLTIDSLVQIKKELQIRGITVHYKKIEFDVLNTLLSLDCQVISNDGFSGSVKTGLLTNENSNKRIGFYRDYSLGAKSPFGTGRLTSN